MTNEEKRLRIQAQLDLLGTYVKLRDTIVSKAIMAGFTVHEVSRRTHLSRNTIYRIIRKPDATSAEI